MPGHRNGAADTIGNNGLVANIHGQQSPEIKIGVPWLSALFRRWLFDIVGLDEGTCGRRRLLPGLQGSGWQFKIVVTR